MFLDQWLVAVAEHHHIGLHVVNSLLERPSKMPWIAKNVEHKDAQATELEDLFLIDPRRNIAFIDVAPNGGYRSDPFELPQHLEISDVSCMENVPDALEHLGNLGIKLPVCVRNDSNEVLNHR